MPGRHWKPLSLFRKSPVFRGWRAEQSLQPRVQGPSLQPSCLRPSFLVRPSSALRQGFREGALTNKRGIARSSGAMAPFWVLCFRLTLPSSRSRIEAGRTTWTLVRDHPRIAQHDIDTLVSELLENRINSMPVMKQSS
ncbi:hypothetical protein LIA77_02068 [Sarocladium implicatum]|nr:hypothetical protein LIA77_02068 [Sarocladium implicatum]